MMRRKYGYLGLALLLALASAASAQVAALGPNNPLNGFPLYVKDVNGVKLDLPTPPIGQGATGDPLQVFTPPTMTFEAPITSNPWSMATGFGAEAFFFLAQSTMNVAGGGRAVLVLGVEAAYGAGEPRNVPPDQFLFARLRIRIDAPQLGTYVVTTPWGVRTFVVDTLAKRNINDPMDWGGFAPSPNTNPPIASSFERILIDPVPWRFLRATTMAAGVDAAQWIGDGVTVGTVTGGFNNFNLFRIDGPGIGIGGGNSVETDQFTVSGHIYTGPEAPRTNASRVVVVPLF
jgi:hypothetical protein